jgi:parallel beta-helix repeat protein
MNLRYRWGVLLVATALSLTLASGANAARPVSVDCGATITSDTKLDGDLVNCPNNGIVIGADNVTLDLNGHVIDGDGTEFSACAPDEPCDVGVVEFDHHGVTIKGGSVREFSVGVLVVGATDNRVTDLAVSNNLFSGLIVAESSHSEIERVSASANGLTTDQAGISIFGSRELRIANNAVFENGDIGFFIGGLDDSRIERNSIARNPEAAIVLDGSGNDLSHNSVRNGEDGVIVVGDANTVSHNWLFGTGSCPGECGFGISLEGGTGNVIEANRVVRFHQAGIRVASFEPDTPPTLGNTVSGNLIWASEVDGVLVESTADDTLLVRNMAIGAGDDGIDVESPRTTLTRNSAYRNQDLGIEAVPGVRDGGGNRAGGNGNPAQCTNVMCSPRGS